jgi:hypothetical protein
MALELSQSVSSSSAASFMAAHACMMDASKIPQIRQSHRDALDGQRKRRSLCHESPLFNWLSVAILKRVGHRHSMSHLADQTVKRMYAVLGNQVTGTYALPDRLLIPKEFFLIFTD